MGSGIPHKYHVKNSHFLCRTTLLNQKNQFKAVLQAGGAPRAGNVKHAKGKNADCLYKGYLEAMVMSTR